MDTPARRPILSPVSLLNRDSRHLRSNPESLQTQDLNNSTSSTMPAPMNFSQPVLSDYCYGFDNHDPESLTSPKTFSAWQDFEVTSSPYHLHTRLHNAFGCSTEDYPPPSETFGVSKEAISPWNEANLCEATPPTFMPTGRDAYQHYMGTQGSRDGDSHWKTQAFRSQHVDYPTPQSDFSLSPPQHARRHFGSSEYDSTGRSDRYAPISDTAASQRFFGDLPTSERSYHQQLGASPPGEDRSPYKHDEGGQQPMDESEESDEDGSVNCEPYAQLIFRALKGAPGYRMVLKDIYRWFEKNTDKARKSSKGWQNSIRHNLSMNGVRIPILQVRIVINWVYSQAFRKVDQDPSADEAKKGFIWVLEPSALIEGVKSTTRYRKPGSNKKNGKGRHPAPERQRSGAKGGKAARKAAKLRRSVKVEGSGPWGQEDIPLQSIEVPASYTAAGQPLTPSSMWTPDSLESFLSTTSRPLTPITTDQALYDYGDIKGVTSMVPHGPLFPNDCGTIGADDTTAFSSFVAGDVTTSSPGRTVHRIEL
ncbi:MAG: hypothetical protein Q9188_000383 [Gyalolechia gomerana]